MPNLQRGGHASILLTFLCNFAILTTQRGGYGTMPPLNTPLVTKQANLRLTLIYEQITPAQNVILALALFTQFQSVESQFKQIFGSWLHSRLTLVL